MTETINYKSWTMCLIHEKNEEGKVTIVRI